MQVLTKTFSDDLDFQSIIAGLNNGLREQIISGLSGSSRQVAIAALAEELKRPIVVLTHNMYAAQKIAEDLIECLSSERVALFPAQELLVAEMAAQSPEMLAHRIESLMRLSAGFRGVLVVPYAGFRKLLPPQHIFAEAVIRLNVGDSMNMESLLTRMSEMGYERTDKVEGKGEMSIRGGILDFYPMTASNPCRVEFFDEEIDSIRIFDVAEQRSLEKLEQIDIIPCKEIVIDSKRFHNAAQHAFELLQQQLDKMNDHNAKQKLKEEVLHEIELLRQNQSFPGIAKYISLLYPERQTLQDQLSSDTILIIDEPLRIIETSKQLERDEAEWMTGMLQEGKCLPSFTLSKSHDSLLFRKPFPTLYLSLFLRQIQGTQPQNIVNIVCRSMQSFHGQMNVLKSEVERWKKAGARVLLLAQGRERLDKVKRVFEDYGIDQPELIDGSLQAGFELPSVRMVVITEGEIFTQKQRKVRKVEKKLENAERIKSYQELKVGDYVVHVNHGIGKYVGIGTLEINGIHKDYLHVLYAGGDKLSVPIDQIDLIQKYIGADEGKEPRVYKLGGTEWTKVKTKARSAVQDIADDLIKLYAERQERAGHSFNKDTPYQQDFEGMFSYDETRDQLRAIEEIKEDMELPRPMDRLLCGDVGYGKTEVAIRAAFKAAMDGKQVAVLVPTTILAQQHYETFRERFSGFPFQIRVLSRFRSKKDQNQSIKDIKSGIVDIIIGTHRLLSADIVFKDLGLLIVDEEQRFGVAHKEKLKRLKTNVDVLTLTATPIPRTLHMSMLGVRDLSVIETPPENRFPVQTYVVEHSNALIREVIERELAREGQVYFLFNRVQGIQQMAEQISALVPEARVAVAHGQMPDQELERTILDFLDREFDVLVSTSIIETGVDIPNVNTLIVHDADKMGLSQLYQLRGRVGRSNRIAYAYFCYQRSKVLSEVAEKRLQAIKEFTELGSGFRIAMRDLSIRGAGNLLGAEQHGFIASVGFDLYSQMLAEEIQKRKAEMGENQPDQKATGLQTVIDVQLDAYLPSDYIYDNIQKIEVYKKVAAVASVNEAEDLEDELKDRFGDLPEEVVNLLCVARLKALGSEHGVESIRQRGQDYEILLHSSERDKVNQKFLLTQQQAFENRLRLAPGGSYMLVLKGKGLTAGQSILLIEQFLIQYKQAVKPKGELENASNS